MLVLFALYPPVLLLAKAVYHNVCRAMYALIIIWSLLERLSMPVASEKASSAGIAHSHVATSNMPRTSLPSSLSRSDASLKATKLIAFSSSCLSYPSVALLASSRQRAGAPTVARILGPTPRVRFLCGEGGGELCGRGCLAGECRS